MRHFYLLLTYILFIGNFSNPIFSQSNEGKEFWFGFMEHRDTGENNMVAMITSQENTTGTISIPGANWEFPIQVQANTVSVVRLPQTAEHTGSEFRNAKGIRILMDAPSSVYIHQYFGMRSEATVVLPVESIGREYFVMSYTGIQIGGVDYPSEFLIVATEDSTVVDIELSAPSKSRTLASGQFQVSLNQGQSYQVQAASWSDDLTGTFVSSNKKIALLSGNAWTQVPTPCSFRDNLLEQMYPVSTWGRSFVTVPFQENPYDIFRIMASDNETSVVVSTGDDTTSYELERGETVEYRENDAAFIEADKPIMVAQYQIGTNCTTHPIGDPSMVLINSIEQTRQKMTFFSSSFQAIDENYLNVTTTTADTAFVLLDGSPLSALGSRFFVLPANPEYSYASVSLRSGSHTLESSRCGVSAIAYGYGDVESYAYNGGSSFFKFNAELDPLDACIGDPVSLGLDLNPNRFTFQWNLGDGSISDEPNPQHSYQSTGTFDIAVQVKDECLETESSIQGTVEVKDKEELSVSDAQILCQGDTLQLQVGEQAGLTYLWTGPNGFTSDSNLVQIAKAQPENSGTYTVIGQTADCPTFPAQTEVTIHPQPQPDLGVDTFFCPQKGEILEISPGFFSEYTWEDQSERESRIIELGGEYQVRVTDINGCWASDTLQVDERCPALLTMPNVFSPNGDQVNDAFTFTAEFVDKINLKIFDRWGKVVFSSTDLNATWNGNIPNGNPAKEGVYFWQLEWEGFAENGTRRVERVTGNVLLVR